jgi:hypothetical protein
MTIQTPVPFPDADTWDVIVLGAGAVGENVADRTELPRAFWTAELVDSSTLPMLAVGNHSGLH